MPEEVIKIPCEVYSRVVGYLRPVTSWNVAKRQEFADRKVFTLPNIADDPVMAIQYRELRNNV